MPLLKAWLLNVRKSPEKLRIYRCSHFQTVPVQQLNDFNDSNCNWLAVVLSLILMCCQYRWEYYMWVYLLPVTRATTGLHYQHACKVELKSPSQACKHPLFKKVGTPSGITIYVSRGGQRDMRTKFPLIP